MPAAEQAGSSWHLPPADSAQRTRRRRAAVVPWGRALRRQQRPGRTKVGGERRGAHRSCPSRLRHCCRRSRLFTASSELAAAGTPKRGGDAEPARHGTLPVSIEFRLRAPTAIRWS